MFAFMFLSVRVQRNAGKEKQSKQSQKTERESKHSPKFCHMLNSS